MNRLFLLCSIFALVLTACSDDRIDKPDTEGRRTLPVVLSFAADVMSAPGQGDHSRAIGDPGEGDIFELPHFVYLYVFGYSTTDKSGAPHLIQPSTGNPIILSTSDSDWSVNANGNIYTYNHTIDIHVGDANNFRSGEVYVAASTEDLHLTLNGASDADRLVDLKAKTFDIPSEYMADAYRRNHFLKNLYSSPANLFYEWKNNSYTIENGEYKIPADRTSDAQYYGTVLDAGSKIPHVSMTLYHVAARLDVKWDVKKDANGREPVDKRVTGIRIGNLKSRHCKLFTPTDNTLEGGDGYVEELLPYDSNNASQYWQGRQVCYVIQQGNNNIPFNGTIQLNGNSQRTLNATIQVETPHRDIFTSWLRGFIEL